MSTLPTTLVIDDLVSESSLYWTLGLSVSGLCVTILSYILTSKWMCCCDNKNLLTLLKECCCDCCSSDGTLCNSSGTIALVSGLHLIGKPIMIAVDITYLAIIGIDVKYVDFGLREVPASNFSSLKAAGRDTAEIITAMCTIYEIVTIIIVPLYLGLTACIWNKRQKDPGCMSFLELLCLGGRSHEAYSSWSVCHSLCLGGRSHEAYSSSSVCHYASVGGATRHTVIALSVCLSVTPFLRRTLKGKLWNLQYR